MTQKITAHQKFIRQSPRKMRLVADLVRGLPVKDALNLLTVTNKKASRDIHKVITQAKANAVNNSQLIEDSLVVNSIVIEEGPTFKRWNPVSRGRAHPILKRSSHIKVIVEGKEQASKQS
jgi:large subunit ribosomal protein L22